MLYDSGLKPYKHPIIYDPDEKRYYSRSYRPRDWSASKEYIKSRDLVVPTTPNGLMYECSSGGISGGTEPTWSTTEGATTTDNTVSWKGIAYDLLLDTGDSITASTWTADADATLDNDSIVNGIQTKVRLTAVAVGTTQVTLTNHITVIRGNGDVEEFDRSMIVKVKSL